MDIATLVSTFVMQVGARHVVFDLTDVQKELVRRPGVQATLLFVMFFMATRSAPMAAAMLAAFYLFMNVWLNEHSSYNLLPRALRPSLGHRPETDPAYLYYQNVRRLP